MKQELQQQQQKKQNSGYKFTLINTQNLVDVDSYSKIRVVPTFQARDGFVFL